MKKLLALVLSLMMIVVPFVSGNAETFKGEAQGFKGTITTEVTVENGVITAVTFVGAEETPSIGGAAFEPLAAAIVAAGTVDGVDVIAGATWTSKGAIEAVKNALGLTEEAAAEEVSTASASGLYHGIGVVGTPRLGPGKDDKEMNVYSFNEVIAYVVADEAGRIVDLECDIVEIITPNHDEKEDNFMAGWPGNTWNTDDDCDGKVDGEMTETPEQFAEQLAQWKTKRQKGDAYKMNSATWEAEMDAYESVFKGKTLEEVQAWAAAYCSDVNGRALHGTSTKEQDIAKWDALTAEEKAAMDAISCATMSLNDAHGDIVGAIAKAFENMEPIETENDIASVGLGVKVTPRLGPGKDDKEVPVYSFNTVIAGACYDAEGKVAGVVCDILEVITPNHDGADDNVFAGWPGQSYNSDDNADGTVDSVMEQTEELFQEQVKAFTTKRVLGDKYKMNSGTWVGEMRIFEKFFAGKTMDEITAFVAKHASTLNGRMVTAASTKEADVAQWAALTAEEQAEVDALTGATMSVNDAHGDIIGAIELSWKSAKPSIITITK